MTVEPVGRGPLDFAILAAGAGSRFGPLGSLLPKAAYPVGRRPLLDLQLAAVRLHSRFDAAASEIRVVIPTGDDRLPRLIEQCDAASSVRWIRQVGAARAAAAVRSALDPTRGHDLVCMVGDAYFPTRLLERATSRHAGSPGVTVALARRRDPDAARIAARIGPDGIVGFGVDRSDARRRMLVDAGLWVLGPHARRELLDVVPGDVDRIVTLWEALGAVGLPVRPVRLRREFHLGETRATDRELVRTVGRIARAARSD